MENPARLPSYFALSNIPAFDRAAAAHAVASSVVCRYARKITCLSACPSCLNGLSSHPLSDLATSVTTAKGGFCHVLYSHAIAYINRSEW